MKSKILIRKLKIPQYKSKLIITVCPSVAYAVDFIEDTIHTRIADKNMGGNRAYAAAVEGENGGKVFMLFIRPTSSAGEIGHECKHLTNILFLWHGVRLSLSNDESECYFLEWMIDSAHLAIKQYKKLYIKPKKEQALVERLLNSIHNN